MGGLKGFGKGLEASWWGVYREVSRSRLSGRHESEPEVDRTDNLLVVFLIFSPSSPSSLSVSPLIPPFLILSGTQPQLFSRHTNT